MARESSFPSEIIRLYFTDTKELLIFVREVAYMQLTCRLDQHDPAHSLADPTATADEKRMAVENALAQFLPVDTERRQDTEAWLACCVHASSRPELEPHIHDLQKSMRLGFPELLSAGQDAGLFADDLDVPLEAERLAVLLDGLTLNALLHPDITGPETMLAVLRQHLDSLRPASG
ncbi:TetR family transcriptional regulator C-terminal domain-containing protein [Nocardiopsis gilva]|uniref:TetR family transcriptional regulator C-terminal domain-containing protein n=1 Tax=Nocardiopsis gilva TaxID=280236 RepID=UPI00037147C0|nr:TetR family transcriptional regulator C-terminal domain-containing protein [Nocardiopsis gilva]